MPQKASRSRSRRAGVLAVLVLLLLGCRAQTPAPPGGGAPPDDASTQPPRVGEVRTYATLDSVGFEWRFDSDPEGDARCTLRYREAGSRDWREAWPPYRIRYAPPSPVADRSEPFDGCAGSVFFLRPGTAYELWLALEDPGGPGDEGVVTVRTLSEPAVAPDAPVFYVVPGSGGGSGTAADPYRSIAEAQRHARPGSVFLLRAGEYAGFAGGEIEFDAGGEEGRWVVWKAAEAGVVFTAPVRIAASYVWLEGVHVRGHPDVADEWGLRTYGAPRRVVIRGNTFTDFHYSIALNHGGSAWLIEDNVIVGDKDLRECLDDQDEEIHSATAPRRPGAARGSS